MKELNSAEIVYLIMYFWKNGNLTDKERDYYLDQTLSSEYASKILAR